MDEDLIRKRFLLEDLLALASNPLDQEDVYDAIGDLEGIEIVERRDWEIDKYRRCAWYVFEKVLEKDWPELYAGRVTSLMVDTASFLLGKGFREVEHAHAHCVVVYGDGATVRDDVRVHFGIYQEDGTVISKLSRGHVYRHELRLVPAFFGNNIRFFSEI